ncbi:MAG: TRAP transporter small permease subunit [Ruminococcaceae bacterium]|nr:TRAP transporter small permease subunit [Oscillospiraceae bacterium]
MKTFDKLLGAFVSAQGFLAGLLLAAVILLDIAEISQRILFNRSFIWIQEVSTVMMLWLALCGFSKITYDRGDMVVSFFVRKLPQRIRLAVELFVYLLSIAFLLVALYYAAVLFDRQAGSTTMVAYIPLRLRSLPLLISFFSILACNVKFMIELLLNNSLWKEAQT